MKEVATDNVRLYPSTRPRLKKLAARGNLGRNLPEVIDRLSKLPPKVLERVIAEFNK